MRVVSFLSDFGFDDPYVAEVKAVVLSICRDVVLVDITHGVEKFNVGEGAFILASATRYFPEGSIHVAVVDPGVGGVRRPIIVEGGRSLYVGPDNGLLIPAAAEEGIKGVYEIKNERYLLPRVSETFHGRDVFAPVAAHLARGVSPEDIGERITDYVRYAYPQVRVLDGRVMAKVVHVDSFGNLILNVRGVDATGYGLSPGRWVTIEVKGERTRLPILESYVERGSSSPLILIGGHGFLEVAVYRGSAARWFNISKGSEVSFILEDCR